MFSTTHDAIILVIVVLYVFVGFARVALRNPPSSKVIGWFTAPFIVAAALMILAILW